jgi:glycosyltransferase involved in cell wall biosynthesis
MDQIKVLVVSSVVPNARGLGGELLLHRHLDLSPEIRCETLRWQRFPFRLKLIGKLRQLGFQSFSRSLECLFPVFPPTRLVHESIERFQPALLLSVAHGWWHIRARRVARECNLPVVAFFQDWWPDFPEIPVALRPWVERQFRRTYMESDVAICVSDQMRRELGERPNSFVIHPLPFAFATSRSRTPDFKLPLRVVYFGNLQEYGPQIETALHTLNASDNVRLEVFGASPLWTSGAEDYFHSRGLYHPFIPSDQLMEAAQFYEAVLVVMSFDAALRRRMTTSFPSKMIDAMQLGLPIVVWGPEYCSAVQWARQADRALCVTDPNPSVFRQALEELADAPGEQERLAKSARDAAAGEFNPERIQGQFMDALRRAIYSQDGIASMP